MAHGLSSDGLNIGSMVPPSNDPNQSSNIRSDIQECGELNIQVLNKASDHNSSRHPIDILIFKIVDYKKNNEYCIRLHNTL